MQNLVVLLAASALLAAQGRQLLAPAPAPSPLAGVSNVLNLTDPDVRAWATIFQRYYSLSLTTSARTGTNKSASFETTFLLANAALSAAAARNVEAALESPAASTNLVQNAIDYSRAAGNQAVLVTRAPEAREYAAMNVTAYTQVAGEAAIDAADAGTSRNISGVTNAANRADVAASSAVYAAQAVLTVAFAPAPLVALG